MDIAKVIADALDIRDDIAEATVSAEDPKLVRVRTQGNETYFLHIFDASLPEEPAED